MLAGTITVGDADDDNMVINANVNSHIIPNSDDTFDLGSASQQWRNLYIDGTVEADALTIDGVTLAETIADTVGAMVSSNTETNIAVTYEDGDNTLDFVIGTVNQNTTGSAATLTTARTIGGVSFDGSANIAVTLAATATALATARTIGGTSFDGTANIVPGTATLATTTTVTDSTANTNFPVVFHNESNGLLDDTGALRYNPSTGQIGRASCRVRV